MVRQSTKTHVLVLSPKGRNQRQQAQIARPTQVQQDNIEWINTTTLTDQRQLDELYDNIEEWYSHTHERDLKIVILNVDIFFVQPVKFDFLEPQKPTDRLNHDAVVSTYVQYHLNACKTAITDATSIDINKFVKYLTSNHMEVYLVSNKIPVSFQEVRSRQTWNLDLYQEVVLNVLNLMIDGKTIQPIGRQMPLKRYIEQVIRRYEV